MKSDLVVVEFVDKLGKFNSEKIQSYLDGNNQWEKPINEKDIVKIDYGFSSALANNKTKMLNSAILLIHKIPAKSD